jgi:hypothetical protein
MSRRNAKFATIHDLQGRCSDAVLTKKDLTLIVNGLRTMDKSSFTKRDTNDYNKLLTYLSNLIFNS